ncbi:MAG: P-type conjugative transfer protein TrbG [Candidatus Binataceae bacterium]
MKRISIARAFTLALALAMSLAGCANLQPPAPPPLNLVTEPAPEAEATPPPLTGAELLAHQPPQVQEAVRDHSQDGQWPAYRAPELDLFPFGAEPEPVIECRPLHTTDLQLQAGETITDVAMGDTERWMATPAASGDPRKPVPHLAVKPQIAGIETNLTIYTTKHIYHMMLRSRRSRAMQEVEFYYPGELLAAMRAADAAASKAKLAPLAPHHKSSRIVKTAAVDPAHLDFAYRVSGDKVPWRPIRAFDDGSRVYIQMPAGMKTSEAPALLINAGSGTQMVNYRVKGDYYIVDRLFNQAILISGVGRDQDRITISYAGGAR